ncbi:reverse transcriptase domain-containing protein [Sphingobacterium zeae]|nr:reverse transcriptase domain-containing protein [Sphingobacterium zeae]
MKGIPQGLPISATLANLYLLEFDKTIIKDLIIGKSAFYRRYSDDIIIICPIDEIAHYEATIMSLIENVNLEISKQKTDRYIFKYVGNNKKTRLECFKLDEEYNIIKKDRLIYLGFEYYGYQTLIKSTNLAKYYRRLIKTVERRAKRINNAIINEPTIPKAIFYSQIKKVINRPIKDDLDKADSKVHYKNTINILIKDPSTGQFKMKKIQPNSNNETYKKSTYMGYVNRCVTIHNSKTFLHQLRKRKYILNTAIKNKLKKFTT